MATCLKQVDIVIHQHIYEPPGKQIKNLQYTQKVEKKEYKHTTKENHQTIRGEIKEEKTKNCKNIQKTNNKNGNKYIPIINYFKCK